MDHKTLEELLEKCLSELNLAYKGECNSERSERNAALFLEMQLRLAEYLADAELKAKMAKNEMERSAAQKYFEYKNGALGNEKKMTEAALEQAVLKDQDVFKLKEEIIKNEAEYKKWNYVINVLSNGHIYFRNISKKEFNG